ncbi:MAG: phage tail family protein [Dehalococcoidia bacterium]|nr:phage tail family protein [Dehalococcoidia bacterium]
MDHEISAVQLVYKAYADDSKLTPKTISLGVAMTADDIATLKTNIDTVKGLLNTNVDQHLILDSLNDRYWNARFKSLTGRIKNVLFQGSLEFLCLDPCAYGNDEVSEDYTDNEDPEIITITPGGSALIEPVFILTSSVVDATADIRIRNETLGMELEWTGAIGIGGQLSIDCAIWHVMLNGVASMNITGQFPVLSPGIANVFEIYGFTGNVNITYRNRFI